MKFMLYHWYFSRAIRIPVNGVSSAVFRSFSIQSSFAVAHSSKTVAKRTICNSYFDCRNAILPLTTVPLILPIRCSSSSTVGDVNKSEVKTKTPKPKTVPVPKIMLLDEKGGKLVVTLEEATRIAKRKALHIVHVDNGLGKINTEKDVYKLVSSAKLSEEKGVHPAEVDTEKKTKEPKTVMLKGNTGQNDVMSKVKQMVKWVEKGYPVRVFIGSDKGNSEDVFRLIEANLKETPEIKISQKVVKGTEIRFSVQGQGSKVPKKSKVVEGKKSELDSSEDDGDDENEAKGYTKRKAI